VGKGRMGSAHSHSLTCSYNFKIAGWYEKSLSHKQKSFLSQKRQDAISGLEFERTSFPSTVTDVVIKVV